MPRLYARIVGTPRVKDGWREYRAGDIRVDWGTPRPRFTSITIVTRSREEIDDIMISPDVLVLQDDETKLIWRIKPGWFELGPPEPDRPDPHPDDQATKLFWTEADAEAYTTSRGLALIEAIKLVEGPPADFADILERGGRPEAAERIRRTIPEWGVGPSGPWEEE